MIMSSRLFQKARFKIAGDCGLLVEYGEGINEEVNAKVRKMAKVIRQHSPAGIVEIIPTYRSLVIVYDPDLTKPTRLKSTINSLEERLNEVSIPPSVVVEIPVCYGQEFGPDMNTVCKAHKLTEDEAIRLHSEPEYLIYMIGYTPGFSFLGGLSERLHTPRLATPRVRVPPGSVGIGNNQTGIYSIGSPGGWQIIGRTPLKLFSPERSRPFLYRAGDKIKFIPITAEKFRNLAEKEND